eukprot:scaffold154619_cov32-Tisochrysis_lutea.AAC.5
MMLGCKPEVKRTPQHAHRDLRPVYSLLNAEAIVPPITHSSRRTLSPHGPVVLQDEYEFAAVQCSQRPLSSYILYFLWIKDLFGFLYCATHYLQLEGPRKKQVTDTLCGSLVEGTKGLFYTLIQLITVPVRWVRICSRLDVHPRRLMQHRAMAVLPRSDARCLGRSPYCSLA